MIILDLESCVGWRSPWRSRSSELPLKAGPNATSPSAWLRDSLCTVGTQERAISNFSVLLWIAPHHLLLLSKPAGLLGKAPALLCSPFQKCCLEWKTPSASICTVLRYLFCVVSFSYYFFLGTQTEINPLHLLSSISPSLS